MSLSYLSLHRIELLLLLEDRMIDLARKNVLYWHQPHPWLEETEGKLSATTEIMLIEENSKRALHEYIEHGDIQPILDL